MTRKSITKHTDSSHLIDSGVSGNAQTGAREIRCDCVSVVVRDALALLVEFIEPEDGGDKFVPKRDMPHLQTLVSHARKALTAATGTDMSDDGRPLSQRLAEKIHNECVIASYPDVYVGFKQEKCAAIVASVIETCAQVAEGISKVSHQRIPAAIRELEVSR